MRSISQHGDLDKEIDRRLVVIWEKNKVYKIHMIQTVFEPKVHATIHTNVNRSCRLRLINHRDRTLRVVQRCIVCT